MAFKEVNDLSCETISLGGVNKATGKPHPKQIEGYYLGKRQVEDKKKKKSGFSYIYVFQTAKGNLGVWGKTDLDRKMGSAEVGAMTRVTQNGTTPTPNGPMYKYKVEIDSENTIEVLDANSASGEAEEATSNAGGYADEEESSLDDDGALDEVIPSAPARRAAAAVAPDAARQAKVQALLNSKRG